jgi:hypothetical protein
MTPSPSAACAFAGIAKDAAAINVIALMAIVLLCIASSKFKGHVRGLYAFRSIFNDQAFTARATLARLAETH